MMRESEKIETIINNGMKIPNDMICPWCSGHMVRKGITHLGSGTNSYQLFCEDCGSMAHFARNYDKFIKGFEIKYIF